MIMKSHVNQEGQKVVAIIDDELLGKVYESDDLQLDFKAQFFNGEKKEPEEIILEIQDAYMLNCAGENTISFLKELGIISDSDINLIQGIPYVYVLASENREE